MGSARLLVEFYQTWGARLFASASPYLGLPHASFLQNLFFSVAKPILLVGADLTLSSNDLITNTPSAVR